MSQWEFENRFCKVEEGVYGRIIKGSKNVKLLRACMNGFLLRRKKTDVLADLPPLRFTTTVLTINDTARYGLVAALKREYNNRFDLRKVGDDELLALLKKQTGSLAELRRKTGLIKVAPVVDKIYSEISNTNRKMLVFAYHHEVIDHLMAGLAALKPVKIDGRDSMSLRDIAIRRFQNDPSVQVAVCQIQAAGVAINLQAASYVLFAESSWVPSENYQAACRAHRIGTQDGVLAEFASLPNSVDETINRVLARKAADLAELFD